SEDLRRACRSVHIQIHTRPVHGGIPCWPVILGVDRGARPPYACPSRSSWPKALGEGRCILGLAMASNREEDASVVPGDKRGRLVPRLHLGKGDPMVVSTSQRAKGFQRILDLTSRLHAWEWFPILLIRLIEGLVFVDSGRHKLFGDLAGFRNFF